MSSILEKQGAILEWNETTKKICQNHSHRWPNFFLSFENQDKSKPNQKKNKWGRGDLRRARAVSWSRRRRAAVWLWRGSPCPRRWWARAARRSGAPSWVCRDSAPPRTSPAHPPRPRPRRNPIRNTDDASTTENKNRQQTSKKKQTNNPNEK